uniref:Uncharacterized protein n=1 Tax=viral metagenome TaxID=1070528 RepID=A0A6C0K046_9ZZZZ
MLRPWTKTKAFKKWKTDVAKNKTAKAPKRKNDMCDTDNFCKGAKDIPRKLMPQIYDAKKFAKIVKRRFGVKTRRTSKAPRNLKPSQNEINGEIVNKIIKTKKTHNNPLVVSEDNYIVDGHHRWAAAKKTKPNKPVPVMVIKAPINDALGVAVATETKRDAF